MGKALELLGPAGCLEAVRDLVPDFDQQRSQGVRFWARCPLHGDTDPSFLYEADKDLWHCYAGCQGGPDGASGGDLIDLFCALRGLDRAEGFAAFLERFAPGARLEPRERAPRPSPAPRPDWTPRAKSEPPALWQKQAHSWVRKCAQRLASSPSLLARVAAWGLTRETVVRWKIGWNLAEDYAAVTSWGLPFCKGKAGREKRVWLPAGLVLPFYRLGRLQAVKVRREHPERGPEALRKLRYFEIEGSQTRFFVFAPEGDERVGAAVVVETERDGALIWQEARGLGLPIWALAAGGAGKRPDAYAHWALSRAEVILNALDSDEAGMKNSFGWWNERYATNLRLPVPRGLGKDAGDLVGRLDIGRWLLARLPGYVRDRWGLAGPAASAPAQPAPAAGPAPGPAGLAELGRWLANCSRAWAAANDKEGIGIGGCDNCPRSPATCDVAREAAFVLCADNELVGFVESRPGGRWRPAEA